MCERWHRFDNFLADMEHRGGANTSADYARTEKSYRPKEHESGARGMARNEGRQERGEVKPCALFLRRGK